ncbi:MAG: glycoside hydrolase family 30 beta sandwich domain-containing protein [Gemmatimonadaceae bacterium]
MTATVAWRRGARTLGVAALVLFAACDRWGGATIEVSAGERLQVMRGWEALIGGMPECNLRAWDLARDRILELSANELGLNRVRLPLRSGTEAHRDPFVPYMRGETTFEDWKRTWTRAENDDADPFHADSAGFQWGFLDYTVETVVVPLREKLRARGESLWVNLDYVGGRTPMHADNPEEYAELVLAAFVHLRDRFGLVPNSMEIINEPNQRDTWSPEQVARALLAARSRLAAAGFTPQFIVPSTTTVEASLEYLDAMVRLPGVREAIGEVSYHGYGGGAPPVLRLAQRAQELGYPTAMLEKMGADEHDLYRDLTVGQISAWQQFAMVHCVQPDSGDGGGIYVRTIQADTLHPVTVLSTKSRRLRHYFRYIALGAQRVKATSSNDRVEATAFVNPDDRAVVVANVDRARTLRVRGLPAGRYGIRYTTDREDNIEGRDTVLSAGATLETRMPGVGVITIFGKR